MDWAKISARLLNWGTPLMVAGALLCLLSGRLTARVAEDRREKAELLVKCAGLGCALIGALRILSID